MLKSLVSTSGTVPDGQQPKEYGDAVHGDKVQGTLIKAENAAINLPESTSVALTVASASMATPDSKIQKLLRRLADEVKQGHIAPSKMRSLQCWYEKVSVDGINGLEAKLAKVDKPPHLVQRAVKYKEDFSKLLEEWSLYPSAQQIFANCLADAEGKYNDNIYPRVNQTSLLEIEQLTANLIIEPLSAQFGDGDLDIDRRAAAGMIYWLADHCHIRWH